MPPRRGFGLSSWRLLFLPADFVDAFEPFAVFPSVADPNKIIAAVRRGHQVLDSIR
jgi:hypothetical protein